MINSYQKTLGLCEWTERILTRWLPSTPMGDDFLSDLFTKTGKFLAVNVLIKILVIFQCKLKSIGKW